jgi:hypothetical protein
MVLIYLCTLESISSLGSTAQGMLVFREMSRPTDLPAEHPIEGILRWDKSDLLMAVRDVSNRGSVGM